MRAIIIGIIMMAISNLYSGVEGIMRYGVGGAGIGVIGEAGGNGSYYNAAELAVGKREVVIGYSIPMSKEIGESEAYSFGISYGRGRYGIGISGVIMNNNGIIGYNERGEQTGIFEATEGVIKIGYGIGLRGGLKVGISESILYEGLYESSMVVSGINIGIEKEIEKIKISGIVNNIVGFGIKKESMRYEELRREIGIGVGYRIWRLEVRGEVISDLKEIRVSSGAGIEIGRRLEVIGGVRGDGYIESGMKLITEGLSVRYSIGYNRVIGMRHKIEAGIRY